METGKRVGRPRSFTPVLHLILEPAGNDVYGYSSDVKLFTVRANRDLYTIGVGVDAVKLIKSIINLGSSGGTASAPQPGGSGQ